MTTHALGAVALGGGHPAYGPLLIAVCILASFVIGSVNPAAIIARLLGRDLRASGSGNPGATNAGRVLGTRWGIVVGVLDVLKGFLPTLL
ncbi:MAG: glycerol-3-phosphate acyltransferase, partial [Nostocoides sp.]